MKTIVVDNRAVSPTKIVYVGRNYIEHIEELNNEVPDEPIFFSKPNSAISEKLCSFHVVFHWQIPIRNISVRPLTVQRGMDMYQREPKHFPASRGRCVNRKLTTCDNRILTTPEKV